MGQLMPQQPWPCLAFLGACAQAIFPELQQESFAFMFAQQLVPSMPHCICFLAFMAQQRCPGLAPLAIMGHCMGWASFCAVFTQHGQAGGVLA